MHPGVARVVESFVDPAVITNTFKAIADEAVGLEPETNSMDEGDDLVDEDRSFFSASLSRYRKKIVGTAVDLDEKFDWAPLKENGTFGGVSHLGFWASVATREAEEANRLNPLLPVAAMLVALPAGEAVDEFSFSSTQRTLSKERNSMSGVTLEMITVVRMFIRNSGIHPEKLFEWIDQAKADGKKAAASK